MAPVCTATKKWSFGERSGIRKTAKDSTHSRIWWDQCAQIKGSNCCQCWVLQSPTQIWLDCTTKLTDALQHIIEFAKRLPGFMKLPQEDQIVLLKSGGWFRKTIWNTAGLHWKLLVSCTCITTAWSGHSEWRYHTSARLRCLETAKTTIFQHAFFSNGD